MIIITHKYIKNTFTQVSLYIYTMYTIYTMYLYFYVFMSLSVQLLYVHMCVKYNSPKATGELPGFCCHSNKNGGLFRVTVPNRRASDLSSLMLERIYIDGWMHML